MGDFNQDGEVNGRPNSAANGNVQFRKDDLSNRALSNMPPKSVTSSVIGIIPLLARDGMTIWPSCPRSGGRRDPSIHLLLADALTIVGSLVP
jgi:hypothetical protein